MPQFSAFLNLTLPELNEFVDSWNEPMNQNFEDLDDWLKDLHDNLVATGTGSTWAALRGAMNSLAERLDVSIASDGTIDVSASQDILDMSTSAYRGQFADPRTRLNDGDRVLYDAGQPVADGRFSPMAAGGPSAGFPHEELDSGIALRAADFGAYTAEPISSPARHAAGGLVVGGGDPLLISSGVGGQIILNAASVPAVFNIDGYLFRLREDVLFDYSLLAGLLTGDYVWLYVERDDANYNSAEFKYSEPGGTPAAKDLRVRKSGSNGVTSNSTFSSAGATFDTAPFKVKEGDILRITSGAAAGDYVIDALDGTLPNTKFTIKGIFPANVSGAPYQIRDHFMPNIGAALSSGTPSDPTSRPPFAAGRTYIGRIQHQGASPPSPRVTFARNGVHDSGWLSITNMATDFPLTVTHELGAVPSSLEIWVRVDSTTPAYRPLVRRQVLTNFDEGDTTVDPGDAKKSDLLFPSLYPRATELSVIVDKFSTVGDPVTPPALFTDAGGTDQTTGEIRIISRR
jgi:hypothetical protein